MNKLAILTVFCLLPACAAPSIDAVVSHSSATFDAIDTSTSELPAPAPRLGSANSTYTNIKFGYFDSKVNSAEDGEIFNLAYGTYFTKLVSFEIEGGYFQTDGAGNNRLRGVPVFANGRVNLPLLFFEVYGGVGLGGIYYDARVNSVEADDWVWGGNAFLGTAFSVLDKVQIGLEGKYYTTERADKLDEKLEGYAVFLYGGFRF